MEVGTVLSSGTVEHLSPFGFGAITGFVFLEDCKTSTTTTSGFGATGGGTILCPTTSLGFGATGGFLVSRRKKEKKRNIRLVRIILCKL